MTQLDLANSNTVTTNSRYFKLFFVSPESYLGSTLIITWLLSKSRDCTVVKVLQELKLFDDFIIIFLSRNPLKYVVKPPKTLFETTLQNPF